MTDRATGVPMGMACGDALRARCDFGHALPADEAVTMTGDGAFGWKPGEGTDATSVAVVILQAAERALADAGYHRVTGLLHHRRTGRPDTSLGLVGDRPHPRPRCRCRRTPERPSAPRAGGSSPRRAGHRHRGRDRRGAARCPVGRIGPSVGEGGRRARLARAQRHRARAAWGGAGRGRRPTRRPQTPGPRPRAHI